MNFPYTSKQYIRLLWWGVTYSTSQEDRAITDSFAKIHETSDFP